MLRKFRKILSLSFAIFWIAAANHCVFEECFFFPFTHTEADEHPHLPNHPGHDIPHQHQGEDSSHTHGQPCPISVLVNTKSSTDLQFNLEKTLNPLVFIPLIFSYLDLSNYSEEISFYFADQTRNQQRHFFSSLTIASNAPPFFV